jgi:ferredoxin
MTSKNDRLAENIPGPWYVDNSCLPCLRCLEEAGPDSPTPLLRPSEDESFVFFVKQPESESEIAAAERALEACPQAAIGKDG